MTEASANLMDLGYKAESTYGTEAVGNFNRFRYTQESLKRTGSTISSKEIRSDRQIADLILTDVGAAGSVSFELSYGAFDDLWKALFMASAWSTPHSITGTTLSITAATHTIADSGTAFTVANGYAVGLLVRITGSTAGNNGIYRIATRADGSLVIDTTSGDFTADESANAALKIELGSYITAGSTFQSFTICKQDTEASGSAFQEVFTGMAVESATLRIGVGNILTGSFNFVGKNSSVGGTARTFVDISGADQDVMNAISDFDMNVNGTDIDVVTEMNWQLKNNLRARKVVGTLGAKSIALGNVEGSGTTTGLVSGIGDYQQWIDFVDSTNILKFTKGTKAYAIDHPRVKYSDGGTSNSGVNTDLSLALSFVTLRDSTLGISARMYRFAG